MTEQSDAQLLRDYAQRGRETAFREIVLRHTDFVYSAALRQVESSDIARDVAQSVFTDLARKARPLAEKMAEGGSLAGWLYRSTRFAALNQMRGERRRLAHERQAMEQLITNSEVAPDWERVRPVLDEAMADLSEEDREALLLRYFKNQDLRTVGLALGVSDDTAQKRVSRAVEKLREFFSKQKITVGAGGLAVLISANAVQSAPVGLAAAISAAAVLAGTTVSTSTAIAATKAIAMTTLQKTIIGAALTAAVGTGVFEAHQASQLREQVQTLYQQQTPLTEQIQQLQNEHNKDTNTIAWLNEELARSDRNNIELLKLRGEASQMRATSQEFAKLKAKEQAAELGADEKAWLERVGLLKQRMAETPEAQIPELKYLTDENWLRTAKHKLENEADYRGALMELDANAQGNFLRLIEKALRKFLDANKDLFPTDMSQLKPYLTDSTDADLLQRYQIQQARAIAGGSQMADNPNDYVITPVQSFGGGQWFLNRNGTGGTSGGGDLMDILAPALKAMSDATPTINGRKSMSIRNLGPYLTTPEQKAAYQNLIETIDKK